VDGEVANYGSYTSLIHRWLEPNSLHIYRVRAKNGDIVYDWSEYISVYTLFSTPINLNASCTANSVIITWDAVNGASTYEVYRDGIIISSVAGVEYEDTSIPINAVCNYSIKACNNTGNTSELSISIGVSMIPTINSDLTLTENVTYEGLNLTGGVLDLNGYTLTVKGNLTQSSGTTYINGGTLEVAGDYKITSLDGSGNSNGYLEMTNESDRVIVGGSFIMDSIHQHGEYLKAGMLEIKGDFTQRSTDTDYYSSFNFYANSSHKVILSGSNIQTVSFEDYSNSWFNILELRNTSSGINFNTYISIRNMKGEFKNFNSTLNLYFGTLSDDVMIYGDVSFTNSDVYLGGKTLSIAGNAVINSGGFNIEGGKLKISGNLTHSGAEMNINSGTLEVAGDYKITSLDGISYSHGFLNMRNESDRVIVGGNFVMDSTRNHTGYLTAGIMEIKGDFTQKSSYYEPRNFCTSGIHKVLLSGSSLQTISFEDYAHSKFNLLEIADTAYGISLSTPVNIPIERIPDLSCKIRSSLMLYVNKALTEDITIIGDLLLTGGTLNVGNNTLHITGNLLHQSGTVNLDRGELIIDGNMTENGSIIHLNGGSLTVDGDLIQAGGMLDLNGGELNINNDCIQPSGGMWINGGTLRVAGDYKITNLDGSGYSIGSINMTKESDRVFVGGSFVMNSNQSHTGYLTAGIMEIKGDFTQKSTFPSGSLGYYNFNCSGTHRVLLSGSDMQTVSFEFYKNSSFKTLIITKPLATGYSFNYRPVWGTLMEISDDIEVPTTPSNLMVNSKTFSTVSLSWTKSTDNITISNYKILRDGIVVGETADTSYTDTELLPDTTYTYTVKAYDYNNNSSSESNAVTVTTDEGTGDTEKPDWYYVRTTDIDGNLLEVYISDIGGSAGESNETITAIVKGSSDILWKEYALSSDSWIDTGATYASAPGGGVVVTAVPALKENSVEEASVSTMESPTFLSIDFESKKNEILNNLYAKIGIDPTELTSEDIKMLALGIVYSIDDNVTFGIVQWLHDNTTGIEPPEDNYYYMRAKAYTDAMFVAAYTKAALGSAAAALSALEGAGLSGGMAVATSPTGVGTVVFGTAAVTELAGAAVMSGVSYASAKLAQRSQNIFSSSISKLQQTLGHKIRSVADDILDRFEGYKGGHTIEKHVSMTNEELIRRANQEGIDATSFENKSTAISSVQKNLRKSADNIEEWLKNTSNQTLTVEMTHQYPIGYGVTANSTNVTYNLIKSRVILIRDDTIDLGFFILTSFPIF